MTAQHYLITAKTHLHVGSGNSNAGVIDNLVQRDPTDNLPCIYASSLKGAFREYFEEGPEKADTDKLADIIFGAGLNKNSSGANAKGTHIFHQASLLSIPARSNVRPFFNATCPMIINKFLEECKLFGKSLDPILVKELKEVVLSQANDGNTTDVYCANIQNLKIEDYLTFNFNTLPVPETKKLFGNDLIVMTDEDFKDLCSDYNLPVIARNNLDNGQSKNLWYEQIVPRQAKFWFFTVTNEGQDDFKTNINKKNVQIGANASIGYGVCQVDNL